MLKIRTAIPSKIDILSNPTFKKGSVEATNIEQDPAIIENMTLTLFSMKVLELNLIIINKANTSPPTFIPVDGCSPNQLLM